MSLELVPSTLTFSMNSLWKFLAGGAVWSITAVFQIRKWKNPAGRKDILGAFGVAIIAGFFATFVPAIWWPWFHLLVYPLLFMSGFVIVIIPIALALALKNARSKAQMVVCSNNLKQVGIGARIWSQDHGDILPKNFEEMKATLASKDLTHCPADKNREYEILSPGAPLADPSVVYVRCPIHNLVIFADGSVHQIGKRELLREKDQWRIKPAPAHSHA